MTYDEIMERAAAAGVQLAGLHISGQLPKRIDELPADSPVVGVYRAAKSVQDSYGTLLEQLASAGAPLEVKEALTRRYHVSIIQEARLLEALNPSLMDPRVDKASVLLLLPWLAKLQNKP